MASLEGKPIYINSETSSESGLALQVRRSELFVQCVQEDSDVFMQEESGREDPANCRVQQAYTGSDDARILTVPFLRKSSL